MDVARWELSTSWDDNQLDWRSIDTLRTVWFDLGAPDDPNRPLLVLVEYEPNVTIAAHAHDSDYSSLVVGGQVRIGRQSHGPGSVRIVAAGTIYGPMVVGPEGARVVDLFTRRHGVIPQFGRVAPEDEARVAAQRTAMLERLEALQPRPRIRPRRQHPSED